MTGLSPAPMPPRTGAHFDNMAIRQGRTSIKGKHARPRQYKRIQYTYDFKLAVIQHYAFAVSVDATIVTFFSHIAPERRSSVRSLITKWRKMRAAIEKRASKVRTAGHTRHREVGTATVLAPRVESDLVTWINNLRRDGIPVSNLMLQLKAIELADNPGFAASPSAIDMRVGEVSEAMDVLDMSDSDDHSN